MGVDKEKTDSKIDNVEIVRDTYDSIASEFDALLTEDNSSKAEVQFVEKYITRLVSKGSVADLGCGVGKHGRYLAKKGFNVIGYDISEKMIKLAKENNSEENGEMILLQVADMRTLQSNVFFDGVIMMYSLIHLTREQAIQTLENIKKYMRKCAWLMVSVYLGNRDGFYIEPLDVEKRQYFKDYSVDEIKEVLETAGFNVNDEDIVCWSDEDEITAGDKDLENGVIGVIAGLKTEGKNQ